MSDMNWIEIVGYVGSALVLVSFLMTSVFKLRVVNTIGSLIFSVYALIIHSYPTAIMNICLVLINLRFLWRLSREAKNYELVVVDPSDAYLAHLLAAWHDDMLECFPRINYKRDDINFACILVNDDEAVGVDLGVERGEELELVLDYSTPAYRDFSLGTYFFAWLEERGIKRVLYKGPASEHGAYLARMGFAKQSTGYVKRF